MSNYLKQTIDDAKDELVCWVRNNPDGDVADAISEIADSSTPIYNYDRLKMLEEDLSLAYVDDSGLLPTDPGVWDILGVSIYERITQKLWEYQRELDDMIATCEHCRCQFLNDDDHFDSIMESYDGAYAEDDADHDRDLYCSVWCVAHAEKDRKDEQGG